MAKIQTYPDVFNTMSQMPGPLGLYGAMLKMEDDAANKLIKAKNFNNPTVDSWVKHKGGYMSGQDKFIANFVAKMNQPPTAQALSVSTQQQQTTPQTTTTSNQTTTTGVNTPTTTANTTTTSPTVQQAPLPPSGYIQPGSTVSDEGDGKWITNPGEAYSWNEQLKDSLRNYMGIKQAMGTPDDPSYQGEIPILMYPNAYAGAQGMTLQSVMEEASNELFNLNKGKIGKAGQEASASVSIPYSTQEELNRVKIDTDLRNEAYTNYMKAYNDAVAANNKAHKDALEQDRVFRKATDPLQYGDMNPIYQTGLFARNPTTGSPFAVLPTSAYRPLNPPDASKYDMKIIPPTVQNYQASSASGISRPPQHNTPPPNAKLITYLTVDKTGSPVLTDIKDSKGNGTNDPTDTAFNAPAIGKSNTNANLSSIANQVLANGSTVMTGMTPFVVGWDANKQPVVKNGNLIDWFDKSLNFLYQWSPPDAKRNRAGFDPNYLSQHISGTNTTDLNNYITKLYAIARDPNAYGMKVDKSTGKATHIITKGAATPWTVEDPSNTPDNPTKIGLNRDYFVSQYDINGNPIYDLNKWQNFLNNDPLMKATIQMMHSLNDKNLQLNPAYSNYDKQQALLALYSTIQGSVFFEGK